MSDISKYLIEYDFIPKTDNFKEKMKIAEIELYKLVDNGRFGIKLKNVRFKKNSSREQFIFKSFINTFEVFKYKKPMKNKIDNEFECKKYNEKAKESNRLKNIRINVIKNALIYEYSGIDVKYSPIHTFLKSVSERDKPLLTQLIINNEYYSKIDLIKNYSGWNDINKNFNGEPNWDKLLLYKNELNYQI